MAAKLTKDDRARIARAIAAAEDGTTGTIAVRIVNDKHLDAVEKAKSEFGHIGMHRHEDGQRRARAGRAARPAVCGDRRQRAARTRRRRVLESAHDRDAPLFCATIRWPTASSTPSTGSANSSARIFRSIRAHDCEAPRRRIRSRRSALAVRVRRRFSRRIFPFRPSDHRSRRFRRRLERIRTNGAGEQARGVRVVDRPSRRGLHRPNDRQRPAGDLDCGDRANVEGRSKRKR